MNLDIDQQAAKDFRVEDLLILAGAGSEKIIPLGAGNQDEQNPHRY